MNTFGNWNDWKVWAISWATPISKSCQCGCHWSSFAHFTRHLGCDGFIRAFGGSAAWSVVSSVLRVAGSGWWLVLFVFPSFVGLGWLWLALFWVAVSLLWSAAGAVYCSPALMRCLLRGSSWIKWWLFNIRWLVSSADKRSNLHQRLRKPQAATPGHAITLKLTAGCEPGLPERNLRKRFPKLF